MNDDFLHRLRKPPPPEFLTGLKARLDRQPKLHHPRRSGFGRGLIVGLLVAGLAFAVTSVSLTGLPTSAGLFFRAPIQLVARLFSGRGASPESNGVPVKAVPLAPWMSAPTNTQPASARDVEPAPSDDSAVYTGPAVNNTAPQAGTFGKATQPLTTVPVRIQRELLTFVTTVSSGSPKGVVIKVNEQPARNIFDAICGNHPTGDPNSIIATTRRITTEQSCLRESHRNDIIELQVGYQGLVLARSKLYGSLNLSARDLFLALARRVPNPERPTELIDNPYITWNQVDPALPYDSIHVYGPARNSPEGRLVAELVLDAGCNSVPTLAALRDHDSATFETACHQLRTDTAYEEVALGTINYTDVLNHSPTALGIMTLTTFRYLQDKLIANPVDGILPDTTTFAAQSYPASRSIYLYTTKLTIDGYWATFVIWPILSPPAFDPHVGTALWGFIEANGAEHPTTQADFLTLKTVQF